MVQPPARSSRLRFKAFRAGKTPSEPAADGSGDDSKRPDKKARRRYLRHYLTWLRPHFPGLALLFLLGLFGVAFQSANPILAAQMVDRCIVTDGALDPRLALLAQLGGVLIGLAMVGVLVSPLRSYLTVRLNARAVVRLRKRLHEHLMRLSFSELSDLKSGGIVSRLSGDVDNATGLIQSAVISPTIATVQAITAMGIIFYWNWRLAIAMTAVVPLLMIAHLFWVRKIRPIYRSIRDDRTAVDARVTETFGGIRVVRAFRREPRERRDYGVGHHTAVRKNIFAHILQSVVGSAWGLLMPAVTIVLMWYGGYLVIQGQAKIGQLFAFQWYVFLLLGPVMQIINSMSTTQRGLAATERIFDLLDKPVDKPDPLDAINAPDQVRQIRFEGVSFEYRPGTPVIKDFSLTVPGGSVTALVGPSGAGKSTLTDLVARFHDPTKGRIFLNDIDLKQIRLAAYRRLLAVVQQDVFLFDGTVRDNIAYGRRGADQQQIIRAAQRANAHDFIVDMVDGYDTVVGERGVKLSGGQRQRVSIARAILADPKILILDEATSNLDSESEQLIQAALAELYVNRTTFVIAHRLSTVTHADMIVVLDAGRIVEVGSHVDLLSAGRMYYDMIERQQQFDQA